MTNDHYSSNDMIYKKEEEGHFLVTQATLFYGFFYTVIPGNDKQPLQCKAH